MQSPPHSDEVGAPFDHSNPFAGVVVCCTSIPPDHRSEIASRVKDLGGVHKYDLTPDITHLVVGEYDTPKYRHVARERPDIKPMAAGWIDAVRDLWMKDHEVDFAQLEAEYQLKTFQSSGGFPSSTAPEERERGKLLICLTGFEEEDRHYIEDTVTNHGGDYVGDLSRRVTHLIVCKPEGKKYQAAKSWGIITVSIEWLDDSVKRGMILDESLYDPLLPKGERGRGAIVVKETRGTSTTKRPREPTTGPAPEEGRRKLRKTASLKFNRESNSIWGDILGGPQVPANASRPLLERRSLSTSVIAPMEDPTQPAPTSGSMLPPTADPAAEEDDGIFSSCRFYVHGFPQHKAQIVSEAVTSRGGRLSTSLSDVSSVVHQEPPDQRFLIVPQTSQPDTHPMLPEGVHIITEFYIERCMHGKQLLDPNDQVLGRPFPRFPIDGFDKLTVCTAGFRNEQLNQVEKTVTQLGAKYGERLNRDTSILVCPSIKDVRTNKLNFALWNKIPIVNADWLWQCISVGCLIPWEKFIFPESKQKLAIDVDPDLQKKHSKLARTRSEPILKKKEQNADLRADPAREAVDATAFTKDKIPVPAEDDSALDIADEGQAPTHVQDDSAVYVSNYETALTHQDELAGVGPMSELHTNALNRSPTSDSKSSEVRKPLRRFPTGGTVGDSEGGDDSDAATITSARGDSVALDREDPSASLLESASKRKVAEERSAERIAMASRLTTLMHQTGADKPNKLTSPLFTAAVPASASRQPRRKREVFGRAVSNASAGSSASAESTPGLLTSNSATTKATRAKSMPGSLDLLHDELLGSGIGGPAAEEDANPPPATQIGYDDPQARRHRRAVMDRIAGKGKGKAAAAAKASQEKEAEKKTIGSLGLGTEAAVGGGGGGGGSTTAVGGRRSTRRR